jgi:flagellar basal body-associated protein FliL
MGLIRRRNDSRKNSNADSTTQSYSPSLKRRTISDHQENLGDGPKISDPTLTDDASSSEDDSEVKKRSPIIKNVIPHPLSKQPQNGSCSKDFKFKHILKMVLIGVFILSIIFIAVIIYNNHTSFHSINSSVGNEIIPNLVNHWDLAMDLIDEMKHSFPLQKRETWISFLSALGSVIENEEPSQPAVLLFIGGNTLIATHTMQCIALILANNTNKLLPAMNSANDILSEVIVKVDKFVSFQNQEETIKKELDTRIRSILNKSYSVVVGPLEKIPPGAAFILHGYCDNFEAPFKKRVIILTATFDSDKPLNSKQLEKRLHELWDHKLGEDKSASIVSRIANNVVFIEPETGSMPCTT